MSQTIIGQLRHCLLSALRKSKGKVDNAYIEDIHRRIKKLEKELSMSQTEMDFEIDKLDTEQCVLMTTLSWKEIENGTP